MVYQAGTNKKFLNEMSEFVLISPVFPMFAIKCLTDSSRNFFNLNQSGANSFLLLIKFLDGLLVGVCR